MAVFIPKSIPFRRRLLSVAIASAPALLAADETPPTTLWDCQPAGEQWNCQQKSRPVGAYPVVPLAPVKQRSKREPGKNEAATKSPSNPWDWVAKSQLSDPEVCDTGCDGAYVAPPADWPDADQKPEISNLHAAASRSKLVNNVVTLEGDVEISQGHRRLTADNASLDRTTNTFIAQGAVTLREPSLLVRANNVRFDLDSSLGEFNEAQFLQHDAHLRGSASLVARNTENTLDLDQAMITHCPPEDEVWTLHASDIHLDNAEGWGSARHARLNIQDVPVFYFPYMTFPIDDRRKTGFLWPTLGTSNSNGFEISTPYYLNLAPNFDATIAPRYIEKRGLMTELELRHLSRYGGYWVLSGAHLEDELYDADATELDREEDDLPPREKRWVGNIKQNGRIGLVGTSIDYSKVSDKDFFRDLSTDSLELRRTTHLNQQATLTYNVNSWLSALTVQQFQTVDEDLAQQYQFMPRLSIERYSNGASFSPNWLVDTEFTQFEHDESWDDGGRFTTGDRAYGEVGVSYPMRWAAGFVAPTAKVRSINYQLDATQFDTDNDTASATTPLASLDMGLVFERDGNGYTQTLEPRLFYLYSDYVDQTDNPNFDTRELDFSYSQLFRDTRFSGNDRLDDANQLSVGVTSRFIEDSQGRETLTLSLGQTFYFEDRRVQLDLPRSEDEQSNSEIASEIQYQPSDNVWLSQTLRWDSRQDYLQEGGLSLHYQTGGDSLYNLSYRFRRDGARNIETGVVDLSQIDASMVLPIADRWDIYARYRYDIEENRSIDDMVGLRYEDCCWAVSLIYQRAFDEEYLDPDSFNPVLERDHIFVLEFQLKGLGNLGNKAYNILRENILGYEDLEP